MKYEDQTEMFLAGIIAAMVLTAFAIHIILN